MLIESKTKLGFGLMRLPRKDDKTIDVEQTKRMVDAYIAAGGRYFDTAFIYEGSEEATREALCDRYPRESYYLATKLNASAFCCGSAAEAKDQIRVSLERTGAGYIDFYLLHSLASGNKKQYEEYGLWDYVRKLKEQGTIRHYGFSFHDSPELLDELLNEHPDAEFVQLQINYADWDDPVIASRACYEVAVQHNVPVIVMEPVKGGILANPPETVKKILTDAAPDMSPASWAVRFVASLENVAIVLSGMSSDAQMADNLSYMEHFEPLSNAEQKVMARAQEELKKIDSIPCTSCHYCTPGCPVGIHIPEIFSVMNVYKMYGRLADAKADYTWRPGGPKASVCIQCGQCESACPQHLPIMSCLEEIVDTLEG